MSAVGLAGGTGRQSSHSGPLGHCAKATTPESGEVAIHNSPDRKIGAPGAGGTADALSRPRGAPTGDRETDRKIGAPGAGGTADALSRPRGAPTGDRETDPICVANPSAAVVC
jgi:hypothetical protein